MSRTNKRAKRPQNRKNNADVRRYMNETVHVKLCFVNAEVMMIDAWKDE